ncbi:hypothetical protein ACTFIV_006972 [Dictyostelium citrinum]
MFNPGFGSNQPNQLQTSNNIGSQPQTPQHQTAQSQTPLRKIITSPMSSSDQLPPVETLNPDALKDLTKLQLQAYLKAHQIVPAVSKPEMKKQMRTLIHAISNNKESLPPNANNAPPGVYPPPIGQSAPTMLMHPVGGNPPPFGYPQPPQQFPGGGTIAPVHQQIQQQLHIQQQHQHQHQHQHQQQQQQLHQQQLQQFQLQQQLIAQQQAQQAAMAAQQQQQLIAQQQYAAQQAALAQQQALAAQQAAQQQQQLLLQQRQQQEEAAKLKNNKTPSKDSVISVLNRSPPHSPRTKEAQSKESTAGEQCVECKSKKSNKDCNNKRCRGCCIKYMIEKKSHICFLHLRDESRRPRIKDPAQTEVINDLITQAQKEQAAANGGKERDINSLANTPSTSNTPLLSSKTNTPLLSANDQSTPPSFTLDSDQLVLEQQQSLPQQILSNTTNTQPPTTTQQPLQSTANLQPQSLHQLPQQQQYHHQHQQDIQNKNDSFGRKIQSYYNNYFIGVQAQVAACSNPKRLTPYRDDRYSFFSCYKCDKVISVNGFQLWRHIQSEHTEDFFKFIKENINSRELTSALLFNSDSIYNNTKQKTTERFNLTIEWLEELFSPIPPPEVTDKKFFNERKAMLLEFEAKLSSLIDSFDENIDPVTSKYSVLENLLKESDTFHKYYDSLSTSQNNEELKNIIQQYENEKNVHFEQRPLVITPYHPSTNSKVAAFEFIESDSNFSLCSL